MAVATKPELNRLRAALHAKLVELLGGLRNRKGIAIEHAADDVDQVQFAAEREITIAKLNLHSVLLRNVRAALGRQNKIHVKTVGVSRFITESCAFGKAA